MAVLCEAISVIVKRSSIDKYLKGGWKQFLKDIPNSTMCTDGELVRVGFMTPNQVQLYIELLVSGGLQFQPPKKIFGIFGGGRNESDIVVVDQHQGPTVQCDWIEFGKFPVGEKKIMASMCWLLEGERLGVGVHMKSTGMDLAYPAGWAPNQESRLQFAEFEDLNARYEFLRNENGLDVLWDKEEQKEVFVANEKH
jgi:hypothetical protein